MSIETFDAELMKSVYCIHSEYINWIDNFSYDIRLQRQRVTVALNNIIEVTNVDNCTIFLFSKRVSSYNENWITELDRLSDSVQLLLLMKFIECFIDKLTIFSFQWIDFISFENCARFEIYWHSFLFWNIHDDVEILKDVLKDFD